MAKLKDDTKIGNEKILEHTDRSFNRVRNRSDDNHREYLNRLVDVSIQITENADEAEDQRGERQDFEEVFNEWRRFSHLGGEQDQGNLDSWIYDSDQDMVFTTANSVELIGFVSPEKREEFIFDVYLAVGDHHDFMGIVLAFAEDDDGKEHSIVALRSPTSGQTGNFGYLNDGSYVSGVHEQWVVAIDWAEHLTGDPFRSDAHRGGAPYYTIYAEAGDSGGGWVVRDNEDVTGEEEQKLTGWEGRWDDWDGPRRVRIRCERDGDNFIVKTTEIANDDEHGDDMFIEEATVEFNLQDLVDAGVERAKYFQGGAHYGYCAASEPDSSYITRRLPAGFEDILDAENNEYWSFNEENDEWEVEPLSNVDKFKAKRFYWNHEHGRLYFSDDQRNPLRLAFYRDLT